MSDTYFPPPPTDPKNPWFPFVIQGDFRSRILYVSNLAWYYPWPPGLAAAVAYSPHG